MPAFTSFSRSSFRGHFLPGGSQCQLSLWAERSFDAAIVHLAIRDGELRALVIGTVFHHPRLMHVSLILFRRRHQRVGAVKLPACLSIDTAKRDPTIRDRA
jgi:hypothetical protein